MMQENTVISKICHCGQKKNVPPFFGYAANSLYYLPPKSDRFLIFLSKHDLNLILGRLKPHSEY
jgi:hypothetical protein